MTTNAREVPVLPRWPQRTIAVLSSIDEGVHAVPVSAPVRAGDRQILVSLHRNRDTVGRIRRWPEVALTFLAEDDLAFTARGSATVVEKPMAVDPDGVDREWIDEAARAGWPLASTR